MSEYPRREQFFAFKFCRLLTKTAAAQDLGADVCWLLTVVANQEDAKRYRGAVTYYNEQLMPLVGVNSHDALGRVRKRAVSLGWLHYEPGGKRTPGRYWVTIPPEYSDVEDGACDEGVEFTYAETRTKAEGKPRESREEAEGKPSATASLSTLTLNPNPSPKEINTHDEIQEVPQTARPEPSRPPVSNPLVDAFERPPGESEFIEAWNATEGTVRNPRKILGTKLAKAFREQIESDADWLRRARDALAKFPLPFYESVNKSMGLPKFLEETTVDEIIAGQFDTPYRGSSTAKGPQIRSGDRHQPGVELGAI